ncbi:hypothetical protein [Pseudonocardia kunmingensis]|uniref:PknH-like protein n=1 Tax=Pseudonocardia kunmingensis TaxID=630975 RepID=A0A543DWG3_9PSEU|nr:hypothetical protein [Pseudonocardia kunmingensis]TQM13680.1 hypothetical protein FB558_0433 [Pseudonocardia kunmingensis]
MNRTCTPRAAVAALAVVAVLSAGCGAGTGGGPAVEAAAPVPSAPAPATPSATSTATAAPDVDGASVPESLLLPDEGGRSDTAEFTDWITDENPDRAWLLDPCRPTAYPTDAQRARFRTVFREGPEAYDARQLGVYPSAEAATEVVAGFRRALEACRTGTTPGGSDWTWATRDEPDLGEDGFLAAVWFGGQQFAPYGHRIAVTRVGDAVFLAYTYGEYSSAEFDGGAEMVQQVAQRFLDSL